MEWSGIILFMLVSISTGTFSVFFSRKLLGSELLLRHNEITAPVHAAVSVMYAVLIGFVMIATWEQYNKAEEIIATETNQIFALDRDISNITTMNLESIDSLIEHYTKTVIASEWPMMISGSMDNFSNAAYEKLWMQMHKIIPQDDHERIWVEHASDRLNKLDEARSERIMIVERHIPLLMWVFLVAGGGIVILFTGLLGSETLRMSLITIIPLAMIIGFMLYIINELDYPFSGTLRIDDESFRHVLELIQRTP